jgi:hypothetical protein
LTGVGTSWIDILGSSVCQSRRPGLEVIKEQPSARPARAVLPVSAALEVTPSCGLSSPSFARCVAFFEMLLQFFSLWVRLHPQMAIPAWAVSKCDGGHGAAAGCAQLLLPYAAERLYLFGARPQDMPESFSLSWPECARTIPEQSVQFCPLADNSWTARRGWWVGNRFCQPKGNGPEEVA